LKKAGITEDMLPFIEAQVAPKPEEDLLSVSEAKTLGVPYGTTKEQAKGKMAVAPSVGQEIGVSLGLTPIQVSAANTLAQQLYGSSVMRTDAGYARVVGPIMQRMATGETIDDIADDLRFKGQSVAFTGVLRDAAQQIISKVTSTTAAQNILDRFDDVVTSAGETGNQSKVRDFLKKMAIDQAAGGVEQAKMIMGQERTVEFLDEISQDLQDFEDGGGNTNIFTGTLEAAAAKAGTVVEPELRKLAVKITKARQQYRRSMTGVAFSKGENEEYDEIFPDINKTANFNTAAIDGLREAFRGDVDFFYGFSMGTENYQELFKGVTPTGGQTVNISGQNLSVGTIIENDSGQQGRVEADGSITPL